MIPLPAALLAAEKFWILDPLYVSLGTLLAWFYSIAHSFGLAIVLLTVVVRLATFPLTAKQARSQQELQRLQPELKRIQAKYKNDRQKLNEEMMKFYKENKVNPFGGCLPLVVQFPILIVLYRLILGLIDTPPKHIPRTSAMYSALVESGGEMVSFGMDLAKKAGEVSGAKQVPFLILIALVMATGYYQQRQMTARLPKESRNSQMVMIGKIFPLMFGLISWTIPAGVVVYFLASNIWQIGQQAFMFRKMPPPHLAEKGAKDDKDPGEKGTPKKGEKAGTAGKSAKGDPSAKKGGPTPKRTPGSKAAAGKAAAGKAGRGGKGGKGGKGAGRGAKGRAAPAPLGKAPRDTKRATPAKGTKAAPGGKDGRGRPGAGRPPGKGAPPPSAAKAAAMKGTDGSGSPTAGGGNGQAARGRRRRRGRGSGPTPNASLPGGNGPTKSDGTGAQSSGPASVADAPKKDDE